MTNFPKSQQHSLLWLCGFALIGFLAMTYLAFHQPQSLGNFNNSSTSVTMNDSPMMSAHQHGSHHEKNHANPSTQQTSNNQKSRFVDALLVMGGLGCH